MKNLTPSIHPSSGQNRPTGALVGAAAGPLWPRRRSLGNS